MTFTYTLPPATDRDRVRFLIGDTVETGHRLEDEEIDMVLVETPNRYLAAALCCDVLATTFSAKGKKTVGKLSIENAEIGKDYSERADKLRAMANHLGGDSGGGPEALGQSIAERELVKNDADRVPDYFEIGMHDVHSPAAYQG